MIRVNIAFILLLAGHLDAFSTSSPFGFGRQLTFSRSSLFVEEADSETEAPPKVSNDSDILNSPAFLKRKLEVLQSDIEKADERIKAAKDALESGKAEWGDQIAELQLEVSFTGQTEKSMISWFEYALLYSTRNRLFVQQNNIQERMNALANASDDKAKVEVARAMLEVIDNFDRAFGNISPENEAQSEIEAKYKNAYDMIMKAFNELGIKEVETVGTEFNYEVHNAVMSQPSEEYEEGIVIQEFQKGYLLGDECIRPAAVIVAA